MWEKINKAVTVILTAYGKVYVCGDGCNHSPGRSARYCVYTIMEHVTKVIVDQEVIDKREMGGHLVAMKKEGLRHLLEHMMFKLHLSQLETDASSTIIKLDRDLKGQSNYPFELSF